MSDYQELKDTIFIDTDQSNQSSKKIITLSDTLLALFHATELDWLTKNSSLIYPVLQGISEQSTIPQLSDLSFYSNGYCQTLESAFFTLEFLIPSTIDSNGAWWYLADEHARKSQAQEFERFSAKEQEELTKNAKRLLKLPRR